MHSVRDPIATHNERVKLFAGFVNALGLGMIGFAVLRPMVANPADISWANMWWLIAGLVMHGFSHYIMRYMRRKAEP